MNDQIRVRLLTATRRATRLSALRLCILLGFLCLGALRLLAETDSTSTTLRIKGTLLMIDRSERETKWTDFTVHLSGTRYRIDNRFFNGERFVSGSNGTNSYALNKMANAPASNFEFGKVSAGRFPREELTSGQLCWLAFAASDYFLTNSPNVLPFEGFQENATFLRCDVTLSVKRPHLPRLVKWYGSNNWHFSSGSTTLPYPNGFLAGKYVVTSTTNFGTFEFPLSAELKLFLPSFTGTNHLSDDVVLTQTMRARVNSIESIGTIDDFRPELGAKVQIVDFRFPAGTNGDLLIIDRQNRSWPEPGDRNLAVAGVQQTRK